MRCKFCSAPLPRKGLICDYCGQRNPLNLGILSKVDIEENNSKYDCPVCHIPMENINIGLKKRVLIPRCRECDGVFVSEDIMERLLKTQNFRKEDFDHLLLRFVQDNPRHKQENIVRYRQCPVCNKTMQRINYRAISGVIVDRCLPHGVWLDGGELRQLFEWKKVGGSTKEKHKTTVAVKIPSSTRYRNSEPEPLFDPVGNFLTWLFGGA